LTWAATELHTVVAFPFWSLQPLLSVETIEDQLI
jgi:hypothetical protein